tara:strand:+ start:47 stop:268 length:222 start_codon:yes stop_codon:yes gene_type:complete
MKFRTGKYKGVDIETVKRMSPWYIQWVRENRPEMLRPSRKSQLKPRKKLIPLTPPDLSNDIPMKPNRDFDSAF